MERDFLREHEKVYSFIDNSDIYLWKFDLPKGTKTFVKLRNTVSLPFH